jgi:hypothetical protein
VIDAAGAIYVIGGSNYSIGGGGTYCLDVWVSTDGGARSDSGRGGGRGTGWVLRVLRGTRGVLRGSLGIPRGFARYYVIPLLLQRHSTGTERGTHRVSRDTLGYLSPLWGFRGKFRGTKRAPKVRVCARVRVRAFVCMCPFVLAGVCACAWARVLRCACACLGLPLHLCVCGFIVRLCGGHVCFCIGVNSRSRALAAGVTWASRTSSVPWAGRQGHTSVVDAAGAIYVLGGLGTGRWGPLYMSDAYVSTDGGADRTSQG